MIDRLVRTILVGSIALFFAVVVFNNLTDYSANFAFVSHVLSMDTTFKNPSVMWRAITSPGMHHAAYASIIAWEAATALLCGLATVRMARAVRGDAAAFARGVTTATVGLTASMLLWLGGFLIVGGEWFLMWQSTTWSGQDAAFRMFAVTALVLLIVARRDPSRP